MGSSLTGSARRLPIMFSARGAFHVASNDHNKPTDAIKLGKTGPRGEEATYTHSRQAYLDGCRRFTDVHERLAGVEEWIATMKGQTRDGNVYSHWKVAEQMLGNTIMGTDRFAHLSSATFCLTLGKASK